MINFTKFATHCNCQRLFTVLTSMPLYSGVTLVPPQRCTTTEVYHHRGALRKNGRLDPALA